VLGDRNPASLLLSSKEFGELRFGDQLAVVQHLDRIRKKQGGSFAMVSEAELMLRNPEVMQAVASGMIERRMVESAPQAEKAALAKYIMAEEDADARRELARFLSADEIPQELATALGVSAGIGRIERMKIIEKDAALRDAVLEYYGIKKKVNEGIAISPQPGTAYFSNAAASARAGLGQEADLIRDGLSGKIDLEGKLSDPDAFDDPQFPLYAKLASMREAALEVKEKGLGGIGTETRQLLFESLTSPAEHALRHTSESPIAIDPQSGTLDPFRPAMAVLRGELGLSVARINDVRSQPLKASFHGSDLGIAGDERMYELEISLPKLDPQGRLYGSYFITKAELVTGTFSDPERAPVDPVSLKLPRISREERMVGGESIVLDYDLARLDWGAYSASDVGEMKDAAARFRGQRAEGSLDFREFRKYALNDFEYNTGGGTPDLALPDAFEVPFARFGLLTIGEINEIRAWANERGFWTATVSGSEVGLGERDGLMLRLELPPLSEDGVPKGEYRITDAHWYENDERVNATPEQVAGLKMPRVFVGARGIGDNRSMQTAYDLEKKTATREIVQAGE